MADAVERYLKDHVEPKYGAWDDEGHWGAWAPKVQAGMVRAMAQKILDDQGGGHDWQAAGDSAQFTLAGIFSDVVNMREDYFRRMGQPIEEAFEFSASLTWPGKNEFFDVLVQLAREDRQPPLVLNGETISVRRQSVRSFSEAKAQAPFDCMQISDEGILRLLDHLSTFFGDKNYYCLLVSACMLVRWKGCQVAQVVQGGSVNREISNPSLAGSKPRDMRVLFARQGPHINDAFLRGGSHCNVLVLVGSD